MPQIKVVNDQGQNLGLIHLRIHYLNGDVTFDNYTDPAGNAQWPIPYWPNKWPGDVYEITANLNKDNPNYDSVTVTKDDGEDILIILKSAIWKPTRDEIRNFKGAFCLADAFDYILYGDNKRIWTPAFLCYDNYWQDKIIAYFKSQNYTHFPLDLAGKPYHDDYPELADDPSIARKGLLKLLAAHIIPVTAACNDANPDVVLESYKQNTDIIPASFPMWEMNGPCQDDSDRMFRITEAVRNAGPDVITYLHFTAGHGSMGEPEGYWWQKCAAIGIQGLFSQADGYDVNHDTGDPEAVAAGLEDTAAHLHGQRPGWEGLNLDNIAFEQTTTPVYHKLWGWNTERQKNYGDYLITHCPNIAGWCDGAHV